MKVARQVIFLVDRVPLEPAALFSQDHTGRPSKSGLKSDVKRHIILSIWSSMIISKTQVLSSFGVPVIFSLGFLFIRVFFDFCRGSCYSMDWQVHKAARHGTVGRGFWPKRGTWRWRWRTDSEHDVGWVASFGVYLTFERPHCDKIRIHVQMVTLKQYQSTL